ncbi:MAG TPA: VWA domain-containing protein [Thermoanaerobaculia bacterium]
MSKVTKKLAAAAFLILLSISVQAQAPAAGEQIQVTLVEVPVNVVDRGGNSVRNLKAANFQVFDSGQRRNITHFDVIDLSTPVTREAAGPAAAAATRNFLLLFDLNSTEPGMLARAQKAASNFVNSAAVTADRLAVGTFSTQSGFHLLTSFTNDTKLVSAAVDSLGAPKMFHPVDPLLLSSIEMHNAADAAELSGGKNAGMIAEDLKERARAMDRARNDEQRQFIRRTLDGYADLAHTLDRVPGRKQVILLTQGFDAKLLHGRESINSKQAQDEQQQIEHGQVWGVDTDNRYGNSEALNDLRSMIEVCRRSDVVLHAIDIKGIRTSIDVTNVNPAISNESLFLVTHDTGGMVFKDANNLDEDFQKLLRSEEVTYVLGFETSGSAPGKFHDLNVKLVDVPSARAMHRAGYFETSPASTPVERTLTAAEIVANQLPQTDIGVRSMATPFPRSDGRAQVPVIVEIDGPTILRAANGNQLQSEVLIYAFDDKGIVRDFVHQPVGVDLGKLRDRLQHRGIRVYETLMLPPGHYSVRSLVRAGKQPMYGFSGISIDVPAFDQAAILGGSVIDDRPGEWVPVKPPDRPSVAGEYPFLIGGAVLVPFAGPVLRPGVLAHIGLFVGHLAAGKVNVAGDISGRQTPVNVSARTNASDGTAKLLLDFTPPALPPGDYVLNLRIAEGSKSVAAVPFAVR